MSICRSSIQTDWGRFVIEANDAGLSRLIFPELADRVKDTPYSSAVICDAQKQLKHYFAGKAYDFTQLDYDFSEVTDFQKKILRVLLKQGAKCLSYADLAGLAGFPKSSRAVGTAMNKNPFPILIPCHRVILADGSLGQYAFGPQWKQKLLRHENIL